MTEAITLEVCVDGVHGLAAAIDGGAGRIAIMPGAGIHADNVDLLRARLPLTDVHASCSEPPPENKARVAALPATSPMLESARDSHP
jgi:copper homeostasis protein CutC